MPTTIRKTVAKGNKSPIVSQISDNDKQEDKPKEQKSGNNTSGIPTITGSLVEKDQDIPIAPTNLYDHKAAIEKSKERIVIGKEISETEKEEIFRQEQYRRSGRRT